MYRKIIGFKLGYCQKNFWFNNAQHCGTTEISILKG